MANAIYVRKSRKDREMGDQTVEETLAKHEQILTELAENNGMKIDKVYRELVSGESIQDRPVMQQLMMDIYANKYEYVFVVEIQRLARGATMDQGQVANAFKFSNTKIMTPLKTYDPNDPFDEEYFEFELFMSRNEFKVINRRLERGRLSAVKDGNYLGTRPPYGYDILKRGKHDRTLIPNHEAEIVKMMFTWLTVENLSPAKIARKLNDLGIPTKSGKREWNPETIRDMFQNEHYTGRIHWGKRPLERVYDGEKVVKKIGRKTEYLIVDGKHEALVTDEQFDKAREIIELKSVPVKIENKVANPLAGVIKCKNCGRAMKRVAYDHARDRLAHPHSRLCKVKSVPLDDIIEAVCHGLKHHVADFEFKMTDRHEIEKATRLKSEIKILEKELDEQRKRKVRAFEGFESGIYSKEDFIERRDTIAKRINDIEARLEEAMTTVPEQIDYKELIIKCHEVIDSLKDTKIDIKHKNQMLKGVIAKIDYSHDGKKPALDMTLR